MWLVVLLAVLLEDLVLLGELGLDGLLEPLEHLLDVLVLRLRQEELLAHPEWIQTVLLRSSTLSCLVDRVLRRLVHYEILLVRVILDAIDAQHTDHLLLLIEVLSNRWHFLL